MGALELFFRCQHISDYEKSSTKRRETAFALEMEKKYDKIIHCCSQLDD